MDVSGAEVDRAIVRDPYSVLLEVKGDSSRGDDSNGVWGVPYEGEIVSVAGNEGKTGTDSNHGPTKGVGSKFVYSGYDGGYSNLGTGCGKSMAGNSVWYGSSPKRKGRPD
jgi:hypothetical protein